jgi:uncharacterized protein
MLAESTQVGNMMMRVLWAKRLAVAIIFAPALALAQFSDSYTFLKAVRESDGGKATELAQRPGTGPVLVNTRDPATGEAALHIVAKRRDMVWLSFLIGKGAAVNQRDGQGNTALLLATQLGWSEGMGVLIDRKALVDLGNSSGETPLIRAVRNRDLTAARLLLAAGADPNRADTGTGLTARQQAERDPRAGTILQAINSAKPKPKAKIGPN